MSVRSGFTLIEILVVVSVSMIMVGVGLAQYNQFREEQGLLRAANKFVTELREVQQRADIGKREFCVGRNLNQELSYYRVLKRDMSSANVIEGCSNPDENTILTDNVIYLADGISFSDTDFNITFPVLSQNSISPVDLVLKSVTGRCSVMVSLNAGRDISISEVSCP